MRHGRARRRLHASPPPKAEGTGLGLSISKALAEALGGRLEVHTQLGQGSVFEVLLPLGPLPSREKVERPEVG